MSNDRRRIAIASTLVIAAGGAAWGAQPAAHILHHESIAITAQKSGTSERVSFEAYGKRFDLLLEPNTRIQSAGDVVPLRGSLVGIAGSWARLTRDASGRWQGMVSDGREIYAIESAADIESMAVQPLQKSGASASVIYRLADLVVEWGPAFCEALPAGEKTTALDAFKSLGAEVQAEALASPTKQVAIGVVGDYEFSSYFASTYTTPEQAIVTRMNIVDGIFSDQVGVTIAMPTVKIFTSALDPFTKSASKDLLDEVRKYRRDTSEQSSRGLTHLMTGRDMSGDTVGVAYLGTVCGGEYAVSLSEGSRSTTMAALIAAHEIGHNFNAPHDGEGACATESQTFLMAPRLTGSDQFSACSLQQMEPKVSTARCLTAYSPADASVEVISSSVAGTVSNAITVPFNVRSMGGVGSEDVSVTATIPSQLTVSSSTATDGTCTAGAGSVTCTLGTLEAGAASEITLNLTSSTAGTFPIDISLSSSNDTLSSNNTGRVDVVMTASTPNPGSPVNASSDSGGGGGALGFGSLLTLAALTSWRRFRTQQMRRRIA